jgi:diaminopimelate epimerase
MRIEFSKYEGLGNDFILVEQSIDDVVAIALCDRRRGVGADGVLIVTSADDVVAMRTIHCDGSTADTSGNGFHCVALHLLRTSRVGLDEPFQVMTGVGAHTCRVLEACRVLEEGGSAVIEVLMQPASLSPHDIGLASDKALIDTPIDIGAELIDVDVDTLRLTVVSMGEPYAITFDDLLDAEIRRLGPMIAKHVLFPEGATAAFAKMTGPQSMEVRVFERVAGWTEGCGSSACAAAVAAVATARARSDEPIEVHLSDGALTVTIAEHGARVRMTGAARHVFDSTIDV